MKKLKLIMIFFALSLLLNSCNLQTNQETEEDIVATQVDKMLTEIALEQEPLPTETLAPSPTEPQPTIEETPTNTPTVTETATPTPLPDDPEQLLGGPAWREDFSGATSPWDFESPQAVFSTYDGYLNLTARANPNWHSWWVHSPYLQNAYVQATIEMDQCAGADRFGLAVRASSEGDQFYFLSISCDGRWGFFRMAPDVNITQIQGFQSAAPLSDISNGPHRVGIWMKGSNFTFYVDGQEIGTASDTTLPGSGYTGFLIAYANTSGFTVRVDELQYWNVP